MRGAGVLLMLLSACSLVPAAEQLTRREDVRQFIDDVSRRNGIPAEEISAALSQARFSAEVVSAVSQPAEALPWHRYRRIFLQPDRIQGGARYWHDHDEFLRLASDTYGVPAEIIVAIIGVETRYGRNAGKYRVLDALATLAFDYPKRAPFFRGELEQFLLLAREQELNLLSVRGSYAGAMGTPQFIPSSYRRFAVDFDGDGRKDIWGDHADAIGSVGNYFKEHGWLSGGLVALPLPAGITPADTLLSGDLEPRLTVEQLSENGLAPPLPIPPGAKSKLLALELESGREHWLGFWNFYVITRYNHSVHYAMAVYQLADEIRRARESAVAAELKGKPDA
ncbi:MAG: lytic murein transglycosylase B [Gammaproteobacteria bacterium]|nr:lytic murein transglycosylase B [Gammaproteobacteria bacterium]